jgi:hypothetical protein
VSAQVVSRRNRNHNVVFSLNHLPRDFKRILRVQMKEFLHYLDESVVENECQVDRKKTA